MLSVGYRDHESQLDTLAPPSVYLCKKDSQKMNLCFYIGYWKWWNKFRLKWFGEGTETEKTTKKISL